MILPLEDEVGLRDALRAPAAVIYKHSPRCGACIASAQEMAFFADGHPGMPVYQIDVVARHALALTIAERLGVIHESPQAILVADGRAVWHASHWEVRALDLEEQLARLPSCAVPTTKPTPGWRSTARSRLAGSITASWPGFGVRGPAVSSMGGCTPAAGA
jgi:bacillithiol system protein YtxJ